MATKKYKIFGRSFFEVESSDKRVEGELRELTSKLDYPKPWLIEALGGETKSGIKVSEESASTLSAVWACTRVLSEAIASLPFSVYEKKTNGDRVKAVSHDYYNLLHDAPNRFMTSFIWRETLQAHLCLWGNAYALIIRNNGGRAIALNPIHPRDVVHQVVVNGEEMFYKINGIETPLPSWQILHIPALSFDGLKGKSPITVARENIGTALALEQFGAGVFKSGGAKRLALVHPGEVKPPTVEKIRKSWESTYGGTDGMNRVAVLDMGLDVKEVGMSPEDAQFIESRRFQLNEIARIFRVPPHMIGDLERSTNNNIEHQSIEFVQYTLRPWLVRWEQEVNRKLFGIKCKWLAEGRCTKPGGVQSPDVQHRRNFSQRRFA